MKNKSAAKLKSDISHRTLKEIGETMDLTKERVRQLEAKALIKLQKQLGLRGLKRINQIL